MAARVLAVVDVSGWTDAAACARAVGAALQRLRARHRVRDSARTRRRRKTATAPLDAPRDAGSTKSNDVPGPPPLFATWCTLVLGLTAEERREGTCIAEAAESEAKDEAGSSENHVLVKYGADPTTPMNAPIKPHGMTEPQLSVWGAPGTSCVFVDVTQGVVLSRNTRRDFVELTPAFEEEVAADAVAAWEARQTRDEGARPMEPAAGPSHRALRSRPAPPSLARLLAPPCPCPSSLAYSRPRPRSLAYSRPAPS